MKGLPWGELYNEYGNKPLDTYTLEAKVAFLMQDPEKIKQVIIKDVYFSPLF